MADNPTINGHRYGWASIEFHIAGNRRPDITELNYSTKGDPGLVRGAGMRVKGDTRGEADHEGSFTLLKSAAQALVRDLGPGFMRKRFNITASYREDGDEGVMTDELFGCRIKNVEDNPKQGNEPLSVKFDLHIYRITYDGVDPFAEPGQEV
jgi:hypothetical protein